MSALRSGFAGVLLTGTAMGVFSAQNGEWVRQQKESEIRTEHAIRIVEPVVWAMSADMSGATMQRFCGLVGDAFTRELRTRQGGAAVRCRAGGHRVDVSIDGRKYATELPVIRADFTLSFDGSAWSGSDPTYTLYKQGMSDE